MFDSRSSRHHTALIGCPPEHRDWKPGDEMFAPSVHFTARIEAFVTVDAGVARPTFIGPGTWLMKHVHIGHDARVHGLCELSPGVVVCGFATVGAEVKIGVNACILPFVHVGHGARIGAGAVVTKNVPAGEVWVGNPARRIERHIEPEDHQEAVTAEWERMCRA